MGNKTSSESSIKNISNQLYVNQSTINQLNEQLNNVVANTIVKNAMNSGGAIINNQEIVFDGMTAEGDIEIGGITQKQVAKVTFSAMNNTQARNDAALQFIQTTINDLKKNVSQDVLTEMEAHAEAKTKTETIALPGSNVSSNAETVNISNVTTITQDVKNISNILKNSVENNFTTDTVTNCVMNINNSQMFRSKDLESKTGNIRVLNITQEQSAVALANCGAITEATNSIINDALSVLDIKVDETNSVMSQTKQVGESKASTTQTGILSQIYNALFNNPLAWIVFSIIILSIIVVIIALLWKLSK